MQLRNRGDKEPKRIEGGGGALYGAGMQRWRGGWTYMGKTKVGVLAVVGLSAVFYSLSLSFIVIIARDISIPTRRYRKYRNLRDIGGFRLFLSCKIMIPLLSQHQPLDHVISALKSVHYTIPRLLS